MSAPLVRPVLSRRIATGRRLVVLALAAILAAGIPGTAAAGTTRQVAMGVSMLQDRSLDAYQSFVAASGRAPAAWSFWVNWGGTKTALPDAALLGALRAAGTVPLVIWQPVDPADPTSLDFTYARIASGKLDSYIRGFAHQVHAYGGRVLIRFAHEFDGDWFPWGVLGSNRLAGNDPTTFRKAWIRIWNIFRGTGSGRGLARNARFIWSPLGCDCSGKMKSLWPGKQYVDYLGLTAFNWAGFHLDRSGKPLAWQSLDSIVGMRLRGFRFLPGNKSVILTEVGSNYTGGNKAAWITGGYGRVYSRYPQVKAVLYFNVDMNQANDPGHTEDWLLTTPDDTALQAYRKLLTQTRFKGRV
jgi:hypothetical protein